MFSIACDETDRSSEPMTRNPPVQLGRVARAQLAREGACLNLQGGGKGLLSGLIYYRKGAEHLPQSPQPTTPHSEG
jgi:hypothetical protein